MDIAQIISLQTKEGHEYLIKLTPLQIDVIPDGVSVPIVDIAIELVNEVEATNNARTLFQISDVLNDYAINHDVILYCYCDMAPINKRNPHLLNQEFRSLLFMRMFERQNNEDYVNEQIIIDDPVNGNHYIHLFSKKHNTPSIDIISQELQKFNK